MADIGEIPSWAGNVAFGGILLAWLEVRFARRSECKLTHKTVDERLTERADRTHELRDIVTPLVTKFAVLENNVGHLTTVVESIAEKVGANGFTPRTRKRLTPVPHEED